MTHYNEEQRAAQTDGLGSESINDVIGARDDDIATTTLAGRISALEQHAHAPAKVYPTLADNITLTSNAASWVLGALVEIVPASTVTKRFDIHHVHLTNISVQKEYELVLYQGAGDTEIGRTRFEGIAGGKIDHLPMRTSLIPANARIRAAIAVKDGGAATCDLSVSYQEHDS